MAISCKQPQTIQTSWIFQFSFLYYLPLFRGLFMIRLKKILLVIIHLGDVKGHFKNRSKNSSQRFYKSEGVGKVGGYGAQALLTQMQIFFYYYLHCNMSHKTQCLNFHWQFLELLDGNSLKLQSSILMSNIFYLEMLLTSLLW